MRSTLRVLPFTRVAVRQASVAQATLAKEPSTTPNSRVAVIVPVGSRHETQRNLGAAHALRSAALLSGEDKSAFLITRSIQQLGASLHVNTGRETTTYTLECPREYLFEGLDCLQQMTLRSAYKRFEWGDVPTRMSLELQALSQDPSAVAHELLLAAAYRDDENSLGRSVFAPSHAISKLQPENVYSLLGAMTQLPRVVCFGSDVHDSVQKVKDKFKVLHGGEGEALAKPVGYRGGQLRKESGGNTSHVALGFEGFNFAQEDERAAANVLAHYINGGSDIPHHSDADVEHSLASKIASQAHDTIFYIHARHDGYSDSGLFSIHLACDAEHSESLLRAMMKSLKRSSLDEKAVNAARAAAKVNAAKWFSSFNGRTELEAERMLGGKTASFEDITTCLDGVKTADITNVAKKLFSSKLSMGATGNLANVPQVDAL